MEAEPSRPGRDTEKDGGAAVPYPAGGPAWHTTGAGVPPQPAGREGPAVPPVPQRPPDTVPPLAAWLRTPRPEAEPGIFRCGFRPRPPLDPERTPTRQLVSGALVSLLIGSLLRSLLRNGYLGDFWRWPLYLLTPDSWVGADGTDPSRAEKMNFIHADSIYEDLVFLILAVVFGRLGHWGELARRVDARLRSGSAPAVRPEPLPLTPGADPVQWPQLRTAGASEAADRLAAELLGGRMTDVDHARIERAWHSVRAFPGRLPDFTASVVRHGAAACAHPSGLRDLPRRAARHDLTLGQVRVGTAADSTRNPHEYRGAGLALDPDVLATSALIVGPPGAGKTTGLVRPVVESLCLQALAGRAAVVAVTTEGARLAADDAFDVVVRPGRPESDHDLDLYGGSREPDEAAAVLAEALAGDVAAPSGDGRRAATCLAQLIGPFRAAHGRFPTVPELRELLDGPPGVLDALRERLRPRGETAQLRELDAHERQLGRPGDATPLLADRIALLDRPAFAGFFQPEGAAGAGHRPFSLRALEHPLRVRIDLPERGHTEASRILARLVLAQFTASAAAREDQSLFACLVLDDAARTVTEEALRGLQRLRSAHAGAVLTLRALDEVPQALRAPLLGAVGCRMVCAGVTPWDAERFAEVWGTEWVQTRDVTNRQLVSDEPFTRLMHAVRRLATGKHVTAESITVRTVQRQRWSASDLANELPPGHAVLSLTTARGRRTPPLLARLGE